MLSASPWKRWEILGFILAISIVTYIDRVNISVAGGAISREYGFSRLQLGSIFGGFALGYSLCQIPGGWFGDRFGYKRVLVFALLWWSATTCLTAWVGSSPLVLLLGLAPAFWVVRFLIGVGEAASYPCGGGLIRQWFPDRLHAFASGIMFSGVGLGSAVTPPLIAWIIFRWGWRSCFYISSAIGIVLAVAVMVRVSDLPAQAGAETLGSLAAAPAQDAVELTGPSRWRQILHDRNVWLLTASDFLNAYIAYIYFFWFYLYLVNVRGLSPMRASYFAAVPFVAIAVGAPLGGWISDHLVPGMGKVRSRRVVAMGGLVPCAVLLYFAPSIQAAGWSITCFALAAGFLYVSLGSYWAAAIEILPKDAGTVCGIMNTGANLGGTVSPLLTAWVAGWGGWVLAFRLAAAFALLAGLLWLFVGQNVER